MILRAPWLAIGLGAVSLAAGGFLVGRHGGRTRGHGAAESSDDDDRGAEPARRAFPPNLQRLVVPIPVPVQAPQQVEATRPRAPAGGPTEEQLAQARARQAELDGVMVHEVAPLHTEAQLSSYLSVLLDRAQTLKSIPVTIVEPGRAAIRRVVQDPAERERREAEFMRSLDDLRAKLAAQ